jgi:polyhydroxybutyrate depolymerase
VTVLTSLFLLAVTTSEGTLQTFDVGGMEGQAVVYSNVQKVEAAAAPLVFVFHGRGGHAERSAVRFKVHEHWPEAVVAYMQGLPVQFGSNDSVGQRPGWQRSPGDRGDRDVKFFDVALAQIQAEYTTDPDRVYVLGHSNGARFANVLWNLRGDKLAAICSASAQGGRLIRDCKPKSIFMIMGEEDNIVPFVWQKRSIDLVRNVLDSDLSQAKLDGLARVEPGKDNTELVIYIHPGGHEYPDAATRPVVKFFQRHRRK